MDVTMVTQGGSVLLLTPPLLRIRNVAEDLPHIVLSGLG